MISDNWIETSKSMPSVKEGRWSDPVLVYDGFSITIDSWFNGGAKGKWEKHRGRFTLTPTHWMPLPDFPK